MSTEHEEKLEVWRARHAAMVDLPYAERRRRYQVMKEAYGDDHLGVRVANMLFREGYTTLEEVAALPDSTLRDIRNFGVKAMQRVGRSGDGSPVPEPVRKPNACVPGAPLSQGWHRVSWIDGDTGDSRAVVTDLIDAMVMVQTMLRSTSGYARPSTVRTESWSDGSYFNGVYLMPPTGEEES